MKAKIYKVKAHTNEIVRKKLSRIKDMRITGMVVHPLTDILIIIMCGVICGLEKSEEIMKYGEKKSHFMKQVFGIKKPVSKSTIDRTLDMVDGEELGEVIVEIMKTRILELGEIVAVDGKAIRSTIPKGKTHGGLQILTAYFVESGVVLGQKYVHEKTNEIPVFQEMLSYIDIKGKTITADAMHAQKDTCRMIIAKKGNYVFGLKGNQGTLHKQVDTFFKSDKNIDKMEIFESATEKHHGRVEKRIFYRVLDIEQFETSENWMGLKSIFAVRRIVETKYGVSDEINYYISSLDDTPEKMLKIVRSHWKIESMHWLLDVVFSEDDCSLSSENAQKTLNILRKFALLLHKIFIAEHNLKTSLKSHMFECLLDDDLLTELCS